MVLDLAVWAIATIGPHYNSPLYNTDSVITGSIMAPEMLPASG